jgi:hypothetical protein
VISKRWDLSLGVRKPEIYITRGDIEKMCILYEGWLHSWNSGEISGP